MKAAVLSAFGYDGLSVTEVPEPPKPGPGQVLVRIRALSLNYRDLMIVQGSYNPKMKLPATPLSDAAGDVVDVGPDVTRVKPGDRVMPIFMQKWIAGEPDEAALRSAMGAGDLGVAAEYAHFDQQGLVPIPEHLSYEEAASLPCAGVTAWHALVTEGHLRPEEVVLLQGTGGVSIFALQFAKLMKARVFITSSSDDKLARARELGADATLNYRERQDWDKAARDLTSGRGVDHVVDVGGSGSLARSMKAVRPSGNIYVIGVLGGRAEINFIPVFMRGLRLQGVFVGSREMFEEMNRAIAGHQLRPIIDRVFPFAELEDAMRYMESGAHFGKVCVSVG
jgi:NADPH:quinone reductase-like Zn-dependent oxidoreductase